MFLDARLPGLFWNKVAVTEGGCWNWTAYLDKDGYGRYALPGGGGRYYTHRLTYSSLIQDIPVGYQIDHLCKNTACCNPEHLEPVTSRENVDRSNNYIAVNRRKTHCLRGHALTGDNLVLKRQNQATRRVCRECRNTQSREAMRAKAWKERNRV